MTDNKSFRIKESSSNAYTASLWPISEFFYTLQWDHWDESLTYSKEDVEKNFDRRIWTKIDEALPRSFKFYYVSQPDIIYTYTQSKEGNPFISWEGNSARYYSEDVVRKYIQQGNWIVVPSEPEKKDISNLSIKLSVDSAEANKQLAHTIALAKELEEAIKSLRNVLGDEFVTLDVEGIV